MAELLRTVRRHWKKSALAALALGGAGRWLHGHHRYWRWRWRWDWTISYAGRHVKKHRYGKVNFTQFLAAYYPRHDQTKLYCRMSPPEFGNQTLPITAKVKKATVFLNPAACKGKARNLFEKNAAPILHLAGIDVTVVKTEYEGQAKKLLELMEETDMIIVAGGDGTLQEVITGLLRREDEATFSKIPIGFIPLGKMNSLSPALYPTNKEQARHILNATLAIVKGETVPLDVLEIQGDKDRPVFAVTGLRWGAYRDAAAKLPKYWYLGPLKDKACHLISIIQTWPPTRQASIAYLGPTEIPPTLSQENLPRPSLWRRILRRLELYWATPKEARVEPVEPLVWEEVEKPTAEVTISTLNKHVHLKRTEDAMNICIEPDAVSKRQFVTTGSQKLTDPFSCPEGSHILQASLCKLHLPEGTEGFFSIDNEDHEAVSVDVKLLPRKLRFFCDSNKSQIQLGESGKPP